MPLSQGDIIRVKCRQKYSGIHDHINTMHFIYDTIGVPNTELTLMEDLSATLGQAYAQLETLLSNRLDAVDLAYYNVTDDTPIGTSAWGGGYTGGTSTADGMPFDDAALAIAYTGVKRRIGKIYIGGLLESDQNDGQLTSAFQSAMGAFTASLLEMEGSTYGGIWKYVVWSRQNATYSLPTSIHIQPVIGQQERRKPGRGS